MGLARLFTLPGRLVDLLFNRDRIADEADEKLIEQEITAIPGLGLFLRYALIAGLPVDHGEVADETAMLALHTADVQPCTTPTPVWVAPGHVCTRADAPGVIYICIRGNGQAATDWVAIPTSTGLAALLAGKAAAEHTHSLSAITQSGATIGQVAAWSGSAWVPVDQSGGSTASDWSLVAVVDVTSAVASVILPSSGILDPAYEYQIDFSGWDLAGGTDMVLRVDIGAGIITSTTYERAVYYQIAGSSPVSNSYNPSGSSVVLLTTSCASAAKASGTIRFRPGDQAAGKCVFSVDTSYYSSTSRATWLRGVGALSTPVDTAIERVCLYNATNNTTAGRFILRRRPIA